MIPVASPIAQYLAHRDEIRSAVLAVLEGGHYVLGQEVAKLETAFAKYVGVSHAIGVNSGTDALILGLKALGVGRGDHVVTVSHTALATVAAVIATGATPVLVDIEPHTHTLDPVRLEAAIDDRTKAIVVVHLYGQMADLSATMAIADRHGVPVIEDCAQAAGAALGSMSAGATGALGCFSFYPTKNLGAIGDGGMVVTRNPELAESIRRLRQYGWNARRETDVPGINSRLDEIQAAILGAKLPFLDTDNNRRAAIAQRYSSAFSGLPLRAPTIRAGSRHVFHLYVLETPDRDALIADLQKSGVQAAVHYPFAAHQHGGYRDQIILPPAGLPVTESTIKCIVSLPMYPELTDGETDKVIAAVRRHFGA